MGMEGTKAAAGEAATKRAETRAVAWNFIFN